MKAILKATLATSTVMCASLMLGQTEMSKIDRGWAQDMLQVVAKDVRDHYYDPQFHGVNWDTRVAEAKQRINNAPSMNMALSYIADVVDSLNDSHTTFYPPERAHYLDFGWHYQMIGDDRCFITNIRPGSDAEAKGIKPGDEILTLNDTLPERGKLWKLNYLLEVLRPQSSLHILLQLPSDGSSRQVDINAKSMLRKRPTDLSWNWIGEREERFRYMHARYVELGDELMILKLPGFVHEKSEVAGMVGRARKHQTLILDLRGNSGGRVSTLEYFVGAFFDKEIKIADRITRKTSEAVVVKPQHNPFTGKLIVLVDSESASAAEILARVVQLEKRGTVVGDHTSGSVMESKPYTNRLGGNLALFYGESITDANLIMTDGKSLEHVGVTPDERIFPTAKDLAAGRDPVLTRAAEMAGVKLTPDAAGKLFPYEWPPDQ